MDAKSVVFTILLLQTVNQAYSIKCYECGTDGFENADCASNPVPEKYAKECGKASHMCYLLSMSLTINQSRAISNCASLSGMQCARFEQSVDTPIGKVRSFGRQCVPITMNCDNYMKIAKIQKFTIDSCTLCETDLCNSSSAVNSGIFTLLAAIFVTIFSMRSIS